MSALLKHPLAHGAGVTGIRRAAVIGAGSMGGGIAAQFANAGIPVNLLDVPGKEGSRNRLAEAGLARQIKAGGFMGSGGPALVRTGNTEDDLGRLAEADWIVEAVFEDLGVKRTLYERLEAVAKPGAILSSNTSTIPRAVLVEGRSEAFARAFVITHFFNPPRMMPLVEIVAGPENDAALLARVHAASEAVLGKTTVDCRDTPGFIANRIGCYWMAVAALEAVADGLDVEEADAVHRALGIPRTGVFGLFDLVGIDLVPQVWASLMASLPETDAIHNHDLPGSDLFRGMISEGRLGRKSGAGFYRRAKDGSREALDLDMGTYRAQRDAPDLPGGGRDLPALLEAGGKFSDYAWAVLSAVVVYAAEHGPEIAADVGAVDTAISLGYSWAAGPFALADAAGLESIAKRLKSEGRAVPKLLDEAVSRGGFYGPDGVMATRDGASAATPVTAQLGLSGRAIIEENEAAQLVDIGDGVACFRIRTKMNSFHPDVMTLLRETLARGGRDFGALVLGNEDKRAFSAGADLGFISSMIREGRMAELQAYVATGQELFLSLKYSSFPVIAAMHGFALGGGCEFGLHADVIVAHAELSAGLPEINVGLVPAWGGCTQLLLRASDRATGPTGPVADARKVLDVIGAANISGSAEQAREMGILRDTDEIVMHRSHLLEAAKAKALALLPGYAPPPRARIRVAGESGRAGVLLGAEAHATAGRISATDLDLARRLAFILTGGDAPPHSFLEEEAIMALERETLFALSEKETTLARMEHMLQTGKPLRN